MVKGDDILKTDPSEIEALIQRLSKGCAYAESEAAAGLGSRVRSLKSADCITGTSAGKLD
jgi:hypothetical protein